jgi:hypothetical protein
MSDHKGARLILKALPSATCLIADRDYDSNWFREALADKDIEPCIPPINNRKTPPMIERSIASVIRSRTRSRNLRIGAGSQRGTTDAHTPSSRQSASRQP